MVLVDTSVWVEAERKRVQALVRLAELLESGEAAVSAVTVHELLRSPKLPAEWRSFYEELFAILPVLDLTQLAAEGAAQAWARKGSDSNRDTADALIAATARANGINAVTCDVGFAEWLPGAELLRPS
ncbi:MAG: type II toxin-antitoxin system VapC family toxin [Deltaproteobacteria bacterium]|nr:type II toxin-antitoxin system VapC family toxin [Deltaproteobacteria bacterium]